MPAVSHDSDSAESLDASRHTLIRQLHDHPEDVAATVELQLNTGFETTLFERSFDISTQYYLFYDWGETWQNLSTDHNAMINSAGGGVRAQITRYVEVDFEGLARFNRFPNGGNTPGSGVSPLYGGAFYWRVLTRF